MNVKLLNRIAWEIFADKIYRAHGSGVKKLVEGYKALVRNDNNKELAVHKKSYNEMSNEEFSNRVSGIQKVSGFSLEGYQELRGGNILLAFLKNDVEKFQIDGNQIQDYLIVGNSHDGSSGFFLGTSTHFLRCENEFARLKRFVSIRHTSGADERMEEFMHYFIQYVNNRQKMYKKFNQFGEVIVSDEVREQMALYILSLHKEEKLDEISDSQKAKLNLVHNCIDEEITDLGDNLWGLFNGITRYTTHHVNARTPVFGNALGGKATTNNRAFNFAEEVLKTGSAVKLIKA